MHLEKIKIAGFKSFVDPTTVLIPSHLVAIVGPNGCGKSNIIDAVSWVMGESSAKYLRGESLTDVIFNGSSARKPVGQASVELVFNNQDGSLGGEYASYAEISIRRVINRDSESGYFLNGTRCRRKDIIDIFLGTGLGPRSYSIIGQNMISRLIEAKPDDMRIYLEEAAGISKYKERRRETENRLQHTKDNMVRLDDVRAELEKQLSSLNRQASAAEKFKMLKQEERTLRGQWLAVQWRQHDHKRAQYGLQIQQQETEFEAKQAELGELNFIVDNKRDAHHAANELFQDVQRRYYAVGNEITRMEQDIHHTQERQRQWHADVAQAEQSWSEAKNNLVEIEGELQDLTEEIQQLEPQLSLAIEMTEAAVETHREAEEAMQSWQTQWDQFNQRAAQTTQVAQVEQTRITHLEQRLATIKQRTMQLEQEQTQTDFAQFEKAMIELSEQIAQLTESSLEQNQHLREARDGISAEQAKQRQLTQQLDQVRHQTQHLRGQQTSLEALQQTALGQRNNPVAHWLAQHNLDKQPRLAQHVEVAAGWEQAVEKVLGTYLQAICVDDLSAVTDVIESLQQGSLCVLKQQKFSTLSTTKGILLLDKVKSTWPLERLLAGIYVAETRTDALALCETLSEQESVITREGLWLSPAWLRVSREENPAAGVFQREQELKQLTQQLAELADQQDELETQVAQCKERIQQLEAQRDELQKVTNQSHLQITQTQAQQKMKQERLTELKKRAEQTQTELADYSEQYEQTYSELTAARSVWQKALSELDELADCRNELEQQRDNQREHLQLNRQKLNEIKEKRHQLELRAQTTQSQQRSLQQSMIRMQTQFATLTERKNSLQTNAHPGISLPELEATLTVALSQRLLVEEELNTARGTIQSLEHELRDLETRRQSVERELAKIRDFLETLRLESQSVKVKTETIHEQLQEAHIELEIILQELAVDAVPEILHQQLEQVMQRITRLGPINLVAIEEFAACSERKEYLDKQNADLLAGLATLEDAIAKIDKETRTRFKETFDKVNNRFQELFPKVFGGGRAYLELTGENLLDTGISIMACPPGKRNSTIHLLSGGEKAMTAIALVFSIFHLNPAPFCLLDEVDAPLDDANIGRFCELVRAMSDKTQFIFISHNKLAIEMGEHLMGVTMHEPGVSRLVSVNVDEAVNLAGV